MNFESTTIEQGIAALVAQRNLGASSGPSISLVYPTRDRPTFIYQALRLLKDKDVEIVVSDNYTDPALSCEQICRDSGLINLRYVHPPEPLGMPDNWEYALGAATGDYICYLTDKMFMLPDALGYIRHAIELADSPDVVSWTSDAYYPASKDYFGVGSYWVVSPGFTEPYRAFSPADDLDRRGRAPVSRGEQSASDYTRGKNIFGAYRRDLVERIVSRYGRLFPCLCPDYSSTILAMTEARTAIELATSCVVSVMIPAISDGARMASDDIWALHAMNPVVLPDLLVPGLYASTHNIVAHEFLSLKRDFGLTFEFDAANWLVYCYEDIYGRDRRWSDALVEAEQKGILTAYIESLDPAVAATVHARIAARAVSA